MSETTRQPLWNIHGKTVLITGGTSGIGQATALELAKRGAKVVVVGRNEKRGQQAVRTIQNSSQNHEVYFISADLSRLEDVHRLGETFRFVHNELHVLINNAGGLYGERRLTEDGYEAMLMMNHISPFLLTQLLLPMLDAQAEGRVINVSTGTHRLVQIDIDNLDARNWDYPLNVYARSKLVNMVVGYEWGRRLQYNHKSRVTINFAEPASTNTSMTHQITRDYYPPMMRLTYPFLRLFQRNATLEQAARSSVYLATSPDVSGKTGLYVTPDEQITPSSKSSYSETMGYQLFEMTQAMLPKHVLAVAV